MFIGVSVGRRIKNTLLQWQDISAPILGERWRMTSADNLHMTLRFLGQVSDQQRIKIIKNLPGWVVDYPAVETVSEGLVLLPAQEKVRVVALRFESPANLQALVGKINSGLSEIGFAPPDLPFLPHVSLARHNGKPLQHFDELSDMPMLKKCVLPVESVGVFISESSPNGVVYRCLFEHPLS